MLERIAEDVGCIKKRTHNQPHGMMDTTVPAEPRREEEANGLDMASLFTEMHSL